MLKRNWPVTAAVALGLVLAAILLVAVLAQRDARLAGTNSFVGISAVALPVAPGDERCSVERVPAGADRVTIYAGAFGRRGEPVEVRVESGGRVVTKGRVAGGYPKESQLRVPLRPATSRLDRARVCVRNLGGRRMQFAGNRTSGVSARPHGREEIRLDWLLPGDRSWIGLAPKVDNRFAAAKPTFVGPWTLWALAGLLAAAWAAAIVLVLREARR